MPSQDPKDKAFEQIVDSLTKKIDNNEDMLDDQDEDRLGPRYNRQVSENPSRVRELMRGVKGMPRVETNEQQRLMEELQKEL